MKDEVQSELIRSLQETDVSGNEELDQGADQTKSQEETVPVAQGYENISRSKKKGILNIEFRQGWIFKRFKDTEKFEKRQRNLV